FSLEQSHKTPELILKLSDMMRYMLYKTNGQWVLLEQEITYLQNYVNLQKLRIEGRGQVEFEIQGDPGKLLLAPMLLISYVENAFKHSMDSKSEGIDISLLLRIYERQLYLEIKNNYEPGNPIPDKENGIGHQNTEKRLKLIYPYRHYLSIYPENNYFVVKLRLELHDDPDADY
ncbi:MAG: histidine kinase, partial [Bacteroidota bacterium]